MIYPTNNGDRERSIIVRAFKYDGSEHRRWRARLRRADASLIELDARFEEEIRHALLGTIRPGTISIEYYWPDRWYNVFRFLEPGGEMRNYYCNVNVPPVFDSSGLSFIDLDMAYGRPDLSYRISTRRVRENAARFNYPRRCAVALMGPGRAGLLIESRRSLS